MHVMTARARTRHVAFRIDQALIDAPQFPRTAEWWIRFLPMWCNVVKEQPDGSIYIAVHHSQGSALTRFLAETPQLAAAVTPADPPAGAVPPSPWDLWLEEWHAERAAAGLPSVRPS